MPIDYTIVINGKKLGKVQSVATLIGNQFSITFNGWTLIKKSEQKYQVIDEKGAQCGSFLPGDYGYMTVIEYRKSEDCVLMALLSMLALIWREAAWRQIAERSKRAGG